MGLLESRFAPGGVSGIGAGVSGTEEALCAVAHLAESLSQLPAIATLDWCDQAAGCLQMLAAGPAASVMIATIDADGRIRDLEAIGFATRDHSPTTLSDLRCRADGWDHIGIARPDSSHGIVTFIAEETGGLVWNSSPIGRTWKDLGATRVIMSVAPLGTSVAGRCLIVCIATATTECVPMLSLQTRAIMPVLSHRAVMAVGTERTRRNNWISPKELGVLDQLVLGKSVREIAEELERSPHTVHDHVKSLHRKLGASSRGELIARALGHTSIGAAPGGLPRVDHTDYADPPAGRNENHQNGHGSRGG